ncbi:MAG: alpha-amylase family glycosyl hydrolase [Kineosporiaceae bacterium]
MTTRPFPSLGPPIQDRVGAVEAELFEARVDRWWPDFTEAAAEVYPTDELEELDADVAEIVARSVARRPARLRRRDLDRLVRPDWFAAPDQLAYAAYADRFAGDLVAIRKTLPYLNDLGVTVLHLLPLQTPRPEPHDGGHAVADHRSVRPDLGAVDELSALSADLHGHGMGLGLDLVLTHVAREHEWARRARIGRRRYRGAFHVVSDGARVDRLARSVPPAWPGAAPPFTWDDELGAAVWTTFHPWQWDLDWSNSDVFCASLDIMCSLANLGVDVLRLVGLPFAWKRDGTDCRDLPEVGALLQALRAALRIAAPALAVAAPATVSDDDPGAYTGRGRRAGRGADLAARDDLATHVWAMLATGRTELAARALRRVPHHPPGTAWTLTVRDHDEIRWRVSDADAAAVGVHGADHRAFLTGFYTGQHPGSFARGAGFRVDVPTGPPPGHGEERVVGSTARLAGLEAALELPPGSPREAALDDAVARILLVHAIVLGWGGLPVVWSGDELALRGDLAWDADPVRAGDSRWLHRPAQPWGASPWGERADDRFDASTVTGQVFTGLRHLARVRAGLPQLHASVDSGIVDVGEPAVLAVLRRHPVGPMLGLYNVSGRLVRVDGSVLRHVPGRPRDTLSGTPVRIDATGGFPLPPYAARWLV